MPENILVRLAKEGSLEGFNDALKAEVVRLPHYGSKLMEKVFRALAGGDDISKLEQFLTHPQIDNMILSLDRSALDGLRAAFAKGNALSTKALLGNGRVYDQLENGNVLLIEAIVAGFRAGNAENSAALFDSPLVMKMVDERHSDLMKGLENQLCYVGDLENTKVILAALQPGIINAELKDVISGVISRINEAESISSGVNEKRKEALKVLRQDPGIQALFNSGGLLSEDAEKVLAAIQIQAPEAAKMVDAGKGEPVQQVLGA